MRNKSYLKEKIVWIGMFVISFSTFAQTPYNVVMNLYDDPRTTMAFNWFTGVNVTGGSVKIMHGTNTITVPATCTQQSNYTENKAIVTGLSPNTTYSFQVGGVNGYWSSIGTFTTAKDNKDLFSFIYITDSQVENYNNNPLQTNVNAAFSNCPDAKFWLHCGDLIWDGNNQWEWNLFFEKQQNRLYHYPFVPVIGNHDAQSNVDFKRHFKLNNESFDSFGSTYTYIYGDAQFFALNSERWINTTMLDTTYINDVKTWMRNQVYASPNIKWRIVYFHKSTYTGTDLQAWDTTCKQWRQAMTPLFDELNIDLVLFGHDHLYQVIGPVYDKNTVPNSVSNVQPTTQHDTINATGKSKGTFNVRKGALYFCNSTFCDHWFYPFSLNLMPGGQSTDVPNYRYLFTGMLGQTEKSTYSNVSVSTDLITITTYEVINGNSNFLDEIKVVKSCNVPGCDPCTHELLTFTTNQSISNANYVIADELRIKNNATVTFTNSTVRFYEGAKVIIEPGSKLVINGGIFTAACFGKLWDGIVVLGNPTQQQLAQYQGTVTLSNNAIIEHALCGISAAPTSYGNSGGGIIKATNATFKNNMQAIGYSPYENKNSNGKVIDNVGKFTKCTFLIDDGYRFSSFQYHVTMWEVRGVTFEGCFFDNTATTGGKGAGLYTIDAGYKVNNYCPNVIPQGIDCACPQSSATTPSIFNNQAYGIFASGTGIPYSVHIDQSDFQSIITRGVRIDVINNYRLTRCNFTEIKNCGLYSKNSSGYRIEENNFSASNNVQEIRGIDISQSGNAANLIYNNHFLSLNKGIYISGVNGPSLNSKGPTYPQEEFQLASGLQFVCNYFISGNKYDVYISSSGTVRSQQGSLSAGADNVFGGTQVSSIYSLSPQTITYYHPPLIGNNKFIPKNPTSNITVVGNATPNLCASTFCLPHSGGGGNGTDTKSFPDSLEQYIAMQQQYDQLIAQLKENPELLQELLVLSDAMRALSDHAISRILGDSILYLEALKPWYEVVRTPIAKYALAEVYFYKRNYEQAEMVLNEIPTFFAFDESEMTEHNNYMQFYNFKKQLQRAERTWPQLNESEIAQLQTIAEATKGRSASMAKGVLCFFFDICYEDEVEEGEEGGEVILTKNTPTETQPSDIQNQDLTYELFLYPNPTQSEMTVALNNPAVKIVEMEIYDVTGRKLQQQNLNQSYGTLRMIELAQGIYILKVRLDKGDMVIRKIVKQ